MIKKFFFVNCELFVKRYLCLMRNSDHSVALRVKLLEEKGKSMTTNYCLITYLPWKIALVLSRDPLAKCLNG